LSRDAWWGIADQLCMQERQCVHLSVFKDIRKPKDNWVCPWQQAQEKCAL